jgi:DNA-binding NarL/FixJ family response regulator
VRTDDSSANTRVPTTGPLGARVLIIDDSQVFRHAARVLLERRGYAVVGEADAAAAAFDAVERLTPDAVMLDVRMPGMSGYELSAALTRAHPDLAVLLVSADREVPTLGQIAASGARGFVLKWRLAGTDLTEFWGGA